MPGNGPVTTVPEYATDEDVLIIARGDYWNLANSSETLAAGIDGVILSSDLWSMSSSTVNFESQGVQPQNVILLTQPKAAFQGAGQYFAIDTVAGSTITMRVINKPSGVGQPPAPAAGLSGITFAIKTLESLIEDASYDLKQRFTIDETNFFRSSVYIYNGAEDPYRSLRKACVLQALMTAFSAEIRTDRGDWAQKYLRVKAMYLEVLDRVQVQWGQEQGNLQEPTTVFSCKITR